MNIIALTVSLGARFSFSIILTQMVFIPNLIQSPSQNHEIVCPVNAMQVTGHGNATNTVSERKWWIWTIKILEREFSFAVLDKSWKRWSIWLVSRGTRHYIVIIQLGILCIATPKWHISAKIWCKIAVINRFFYVCDCHCVNAIGCRLWYDKYQFQIWT